MSEIQKTNEAPTVSPAVNHEISNKTSETANKEATKTNEQRRTQSIREQISNLK